MRTLIGRVIWWAVARFAPPLAELIEATSRLRAETEALRRDTARDGLPRGVV